MIFSTYLGGLGSAEGRAVAVDSSGDTYVGGWTYDFDFPTLNPLQASDHQQSTSTSITLTGFVTEFAPSGSSLIYSTYLGGSSTDLPYGNGGDIVNAIAVDSTGNAYVAGSTDATDFPVLNAYDLVYGGQGDAFVSEINPAVVSSITLSPTSLTFPEQATGTTSAPLTATVTNSTSSPVTISSLTTQAGNIWFAVASNSCDTTLQPGASCSFGVTFSPTSAMFSSDYITINDNAFAGLHVLPVYGRGYTPPTATFSSGRIQGNVLDVGGAPVGSTFDSTPLSLMNSGSLPLTVSSITVNGEFTQTNNCIPSVAANSECTIAINFAPTATGTRTGTLTATDNAAGSPQSLTLTGTGEDFFLGVAPGTPSAATVTAGQSATYQISVSPTNGGFTAPISLACSGAPLLAQCSLSSPQAFVYGTTPVTVTVKVTTASLSAAPSGIPRRLPPFSLALKGRRLPAILFLWAVLLAALVVSLARRGPRRRPAWVLMSATLLLLTLWAACGGGGSGATLPPSRTPAGNYTLTITGTSGSLTHNVTVNLTVN